MTTTTDTTAQDTTATTTAEPLLPDADDPIVLADELARDLYRAAQHGGVPAVVAEVAALVRAGYLPPDVDAERLGLDAVGGDLDLRPQATAAIALRAAAERLRAARAAAGPPCDGTCPAHGWDGRSGAPGAPCDVAGTTPAADLAPSRPPAPAWAAGRPADGPAIAIEARLYPATSRRPAEVMLTLSCARVPGETMATSRRLRSCAHHVAAGLLDAGADAAEVLPGVTWSADASAVAVQVTHGEPRPRSGEAQAVDVAAWAAAARLAAARWAGRGRSDDGAGGDARPDGAECCPGCEAHVSGEAEPHHQRHAREHRYD